MPEGKNVQSSVEFALICGKIGGRGRGAGEEFAHIHMKDSWETVLTAEAVGKETG